MNILILYAMGLASLAVIIAGAFFLVIMIVYYIQVVWSKISACAKNTMEYLQNKQDFEVYKADAQRREYEIRLKQGYPRNIPEERFLRLAAYEDTGLEPEEFKQAFTEGAIMQLAGQSLGITPDRLRELAQADREGKIPKYTIGDTIYDRFGYAWEITAVEHRLLAGGPKWIYRCGHIGTNDYCALWEFEVLTRAEAGAALRREQDEYIWRLSKTINL